jgi:hypothetical protein
VAGGKISRRKGRGLIISSEVLNYIDITPQRKENKEITPEPPLRYTLFSYFSAVNK